MLFKPNQKDMLWFQCGPFDFTQEKEHAIFILICFVDKVSMWDIYFYIYKAPKYI